MMTSVYTFFVSDLLGYESPSFDHPLLMFILSVDQDLHAC